MLSILQQNEMISFIGTAVRHKIIEEINTAIFFTILADKVTYCTNLEQVSIVIRFIDCDRRIREEFITVERITGKVRATALLSWLNKHNIDISFVEAKGAMVHSKCHLPPKVTSFYT